MQCRCTNVRQTLGVLQKVKEDAHSWLYKTHPWPAKDKDQRSTNRDPSSGFFSTEKNPEKARGLQVPTTEKRIFKFFDPLAFCTKKQEARGLHSMSAIFAKLHSLHSKEKNPEDIKQKCTSAKRRIKEDHLKISLQEGPGLRLQQLGPWSSIMKCSGAYRWGTLWAPHRPYCREISLGSKAYIPTVWSMGGP